MCMGMGMGLIVRYGSNISQHAQDMSVVLPHTHTHTIVLFTSVYVQMFFLNLWVHGQVVIDLPDVGVHLMMCMDIDIEMGMGMNG